MPTPPSVRMASDLHRLVSLAAPQPRPLVLVGAELGGLVVRLYTHLHPQVTLTHTPASLGNQCREVARF